MNEEDPKNSKTLDPTKWIENHGDVLFKYSLRYVKDKATAEDLVQETLLAAIKGAKSFAGSSSEQTWLIGILKNKISDYYRKAYRDASSEKLTAVIDPDELDFISKGTGIGSWNADRRPADWNVDPNDPVEQKQFWIYLNNCLDKIDPKLAIVYSLKDIYEIEYKEVCNILTVNPTNLRVMLHRARKLLRNCFEKNWIEG